jgi:hypothetical protein
MLAQAYTWTSAVLIVEFDAGSFQLAANDGRLRGISSPVRSEGRFQKLEHLQVTEPNYFRFLDDCGFPSN